MMGSFDLLIYVVVIVCSVTSSTKKFTVAQTNQVSVRPDFSYPALRPSTIDDDQRLAVVQLLQRLIPDRTADFHVRVDRSLLDARGRDFFQVRASDGHVSVIGSTGVAAAWGVHHYLKYSCHAHVSWDYDQLQLPSPLPDAQLTVRANDRFRYYGNVCTESYSHVWWDWRRWQRHLDWAALNGVNLALAFSGQEVLWSRVYSQLGLTASELDKFFSGPAFLAWNRMGNVDGWAGPLPESWRLQQLQLAHQILLHMRQLGMTPVLPAFSGHVPHNLTIVFPDAAITRLGSWNGFGSTYFLNPVDPLFSRIGTAFITELISEFNGTQHVYSCDSFNELTPPNSSAIYLSAAGRSTLAALTAADPDAVWLMQGWLFLNPFWARPQAQAYLTSVPRGRMIVLDLYAEVWPVYDRLESFFGQPFVWCMLHNFGGQRGLQGTVESVLSGPGRGRRFPKSSMVGSGITMEGIFQNYVMYDLMLEAGWRDATQRPDPLSWAGEYAVRRYGGGLNGAEQLQTAWKQLMASVYNHSGAQLSVTGHIHFPLVYRPSLQQDSPMWYNVSRLVTAWRLLVTCCGADDQRGSANLLYDLVDVTREVLALLVSRHHSHIVRAYRQRNIKTIHDEGMSILELLDDMETLLGTQTGFLLGSWLNDARQQAGTEQERALFEWNARNQVTMWGPSGNIVDYAGKQWAGMVADYYTPRWKLFIQYLERCYWLGLRYNQTELNERYLKQVELPFTKSTHVYPHTVTGDTVREVRRIFDKYASAVDLQ